VCPCAESPGIPLFLMALLRAFMLAMAAWGDALAEEAGRCSVERESESEECDFMQLSPSKRFCVPNVFNLWRCPYDSAYYCMAMRKVCNWAFESAAGSIVECTEAAAEADGLCAAAFWEYPPLIPICVTAMSVTIEGACLEAVRKTEEFTTGKCYEACDCICPRKRIGLGDGCTGGENKCCEDGLVCGRFDNSDQNYQCCSSFNVVNGLAWCTNDFGGACSDGNNGNCVADAACGRYNRDGNTYQCCGNYHNYGGVTWCTNAEGNACSDGVNENCMPGLACGKWLRSSSGYACCSNYTVHAHNNVTHCNEIPAPQ